MKYRLYHVVVPVDRNIFRNIFHLALPIIFSNLSYYRDHLESDQGRLERNQGISGIALTG